MRPIRPRQHRILLLPVVVMFNAAISGCAHPQATLPPPPEPRVAQDAVLLRVAEHANGERLHWARVAQCQVSLEISIDASNGLSEAQDPRILDLQISRCLAGALRERVNLLILPELALATDSDSRARLVQTLKDVARSHDMVIVAGSYYDEDRYSRVVVIGPDWMEEGYKMRPSRFEVSPRAGFGMREGKHVLVVNTKYGRIATITCVDFISDDVQHLLRNLATRGSIDFVVNINWNPSAWEFLIEANSLVRRHPVFASVTNTVRVQPPKGCSAAGQNHDTGSCFGHTAVLADLRSQTSDAPNNIQAVARQLPPELLTEDKPSLPYDHLVGDVGAFQEGLLTYELNLRMTREPATTNAPDQGYPTIRDIHVVPLDAATVHP